MSGFGRGEIAIIASGTKTGKPASQAIKGLNPCDFWPAEGSCGEIMTLDEYRAELNSWAITPDDGSGYWACAVYEDGAIGYRREFSCFEKRPDWATHIVWFNK